VSDVRETLQSLLGELVAIDSTSTRSNVPMVGLLERRLAKAGFETHRHVYKDEQGVEKVNLLATRGPSAGLPELALVGHSDCVPFDADWKEALTLTEREGKLYGRGACDTKAFIACAVTAAERVPVSEQHKPLMLVFTADEELGCFGAKKLVEARRGEARYAIVGEPTSLRPIIANKGYCLAEVEVLGKEGHSAYPESGVSAILAAARYLAQLESEAERLRIETDEAFTPPFATVNVGVIQGGKAKNVIAGACRFTVEWRPLPAQNVAHFGDVLERLAKGLEAAVPGARVQVKRLRQDGGVKTSTASKVVQFIVGQTGKTPETVAFGTEAPQMTALGAEAVVFGPGDIRVAHQTGEYVPVDELVRCEEVLEQAIRTFCG
jgi:acetylornithine deacetylase